MTTEMTVLDPKKNTQEQAVETLLAAKRAGRKWVCLRYARTGGYRDIVISDETMKRATTYELQASHITDELLCSLLRWFQWRS